MSCICLLLLFYFFFFNDTATTEIYTLSLHDALPICRGCLPLRCRIRGRSRSRALPRQFLDCRCARIGVALDRKSTRLNSSHGYISYAVFCLKKKKKKKKNVSILRQISVVLSVTSGYL